MQLKMDLIEIFNLFSQLVNKIPVLHWVNVYLGQRVDLGLFNTPHKGQLEVMSYSPMMSVEWRLPGSI